MKTKTDALHVEDTSKVDIQTLSLDSIEQTKSGYYIWLVSIAVGVGGFLFGYDTGIISAVLVVLNEDLGHALSSNEKELITSLTSGGAFFGALAAGCSADKYGRKIGIFLGCIVFVIGAVLQACAFSLAQMAVGRFVIGIGVGSAAMIIPLYIAEVSPAKYRGRMIGLDNMSITGGQLVAYGVGAGLAEVSHGWRYMVGLGAVPALVLAVCLHFCPESPRQLMYHGKSEEAARVVAKIFPNGTDLQVQQKIQHMTIHVEESRALNGESGFWKQLKQLYVVPSNFRALVAACGLMGMQQFTGYNTLMYYSSTLFGIVGFKDPIAVGTIIAGTGFGCTFVYFLMIDRFGRRLILLSTMWGMAVFLAVAAIGFHWIPVRHNLSLETNNIGWPAYLVLASMIIFVIFYSLGIGNLAWVSSEFFPMEIRALGTMMMTCTCWGTNIVVASTFLTQMENTTPSGAFGFYAVLCFIGWVAVYFWYPEVRGMTLEDIREVFNHGFGVKYARRVQKELARQQKAQIESESGSAQFS
ncbi:general substrate transporter [Penicillium canescens]|uniref:General substrate transporter n=1 Tax=Penicillium canescens TaxID=5083 RepID=A0AAD6IJV4_PENCN|nr:general substrate transporter [Penicillium canescens]KAJ6050178.1 general substrate transporter [Penicillium canescens]KAJ6050956.1 general substrate transporter [Penicillium canescens]KAJ6061464.1 general substrate transporter [Penicillium canescens]